MTEALWTSAEAAAATGGESSVDWRANGVSIDSRALARGDLFVAIKGPNFDGHDYVEDALARGAAAAMVERVPDGVAPDAPLLKVADAEQGLRDLAAAARARSKAKICAVTGSVGKTGTKELLSAALADQGKVVATVGNLNNHYGLPLSLARMPANTDYGIFEMGMNHAGEISPLSQLAKPDVAMVTAIAAVHIEYFADLEGIADAKAEIFDGLAEGGAAVIVRDSPFFDRLAEKAKAQGAAMVWGFGIHSFSNARLLAYEPDADGARVEATVGSRHLKYRLQMRGKHWAVNSVGVLAAVQALGGDLDQAAAGLARVAPPEGRGKIIRIQTEGGVISVIDESYNASPVAVRAALDVLAVTKPGRGGRRMVVLGDMLELGDQSRDQHMGLADDIIRHDFDRVHACGRYMADILSALPSDMRGFEAETSQQLAEKVAADVRAGDLVLVKGSAGSRMREIITALSALGTIESEGA